MNKTLNYLKQNKKLSTSLSLVLIALTIFFILPEIFSSKFSIGEKIEEVIEEIKSPKYPPLDKEDYDRRVNDLANNPPPPPPTEQIDTNGNVVLIEAPKPDYLWPPEAPYPNDGAILPFERIIAFYGNLYSRKMGVLGEYDEPEMISRLQAEVDKWNAADPDTPARPALHYIAVVAQGSAGTDGKYRARMPSSEIDKVIAMAKKINALVFLDIQVGFSTIQEELPLFEKYLKMPEVHLGMDPEFSMKGTIPPGKVVGTYDAVDVNYAIDYLSRLVKENNLPPKVLVVHRYTIKMLTNAQDIKPTPEVQVVIHMDGWGPKAKKEGTYKLCVYPDPVQFAGFKLFFKNDLWEAGSSLMTSQELLQLRPKPVYIQYQ